MLCNVIPDTLLRGMEDEIPGTIALSQAVSAPGNLPLNWEDIDRGQKEDVSLQHLWDEAKIDDANQNRIRYVIQNGYLFRCAVNKEGSQVFQVIIPTQYREQCLQFVHANPLFGHLGRMKTLRRLLEVAYWPEIRKDVWKTCKECQTCQQYKPRITKLAGRLQSTPIVEPGFMLGIDLMGPFPKSTRLNEYLLVIVDYCSK